MVNETLEAMALDRLSKGQARLPRTWNSIRTYERLVEKGLAVEDADPNPLLRCFSLAQFAREALAGTR